MPEPTLQQHDLRPPFAQRIVAAAGIAPGAHVVDIGAGTGALSVALLAVGARVTAVELDPARVAVLRAIPGLAVVATDALRLPPPPPPWRVVSNPPFQHTAALLRRWLVGGMPEAIDLVVQREAGEKLAGGAHGHSRSSAFLAAAGSGRLALRLPRDATAPPSRVDLALFSWRRHADAPEPALMAALDALLGHAFAGPQRMADALRGVATPTILRRQAAEHGWRVDAHARMVPAAAWVPLARHLVLCGKLPRG